MNLRLEELEWIQLLLIDTSEGIDAFNDRPLPFSQTILVGHLF